MNLSEILNAIGNFNCDACVQNIEASGIKNNSSKIEAGDIFVSLEGRSNCDYNAYASDAKSRGAVAIITQNPRNSGLPEIIVEDAAEAYSLAAAKLYGNPADKLKIIGVTGTNGKTSTTSLLRHILESAGKKTALIGTIETLIGDERIETGFTTPEQGVLHSLFAKMVNENVEYVIMECSSQALVQKRLFGITFEAAAFTNLTQDHLDYHGSMKAYRDAKCMLFKQTKKAVINADDEAAPYFLKAAENIPVSFYGIDEKNAEFHAKDIEYLDSGIKYTLEENTVSLNVPGRFAVYNSLTAIALAVAVGIDEKQACKSLGFANQVKGRAEIAYKDDEITVIIDYAHTPDAIANILKAIEVKNGRKVVLFGCGGDRDSTKRPLMGSVAARYADLIIVTSDNPRSEDPESIIDDIMLGLKEVTVPVIRIIDRIEAIKFAVKEAQTGDVIFLLGKGHEDYQILSTGKIHLDEREVVDEAVRERKNG